MNENTRIITGEEGGYITAPSLPAYTLYETAKGSQPIPISAYAFENGELYITGPIDDEMAKNFIIMLRIAKSQSRKLKIFINSPGGSVSAGLAMLDAIRSYPFGIDIYICGLAASMAAVIAAGGRKGHRYIMPHSKMMIHEPLIAGGMGGSATSIQRTAESILETKKVINGLLAEFTGKSVKEIDKNTAYDNFFNADEAVAFGLCDAIATGFEDENSEEEY